MDGSQISCFTEHGVKIFSKSQKDYGVISPELFPHNKCSLSGTLLHIKSTRYPRNPEYNIVFDPVHRLFYTFAWHQDGHYFPAPIMVSKDPKSAQQESACNFFSEVRL